MSNETTINARIYQVRRDAKITQKDMAEKIGVKPSTVSRFEQPGQNISSSHIKLICQTFSISKRWLETGEGEMHIISKDNLVNDISTRYHLTPAQIDCLQNLLALPESVQAELIKTICNMVHSTKTALETPPQEDD